METAQKFSLGALVSPSGTRAPSEVSVKITGRGIFCQMEIEYSFSADDPSVPRVFVADRPWNAVLVSVSTNQESMRQSGELGARLPLPKILKAGVGEQLQDGCTYAVCCHVEAGCSLRSITAIFTLTCDVLWHQSFLVFSGPSDPVKVNMEVNWDLNGLPGASLVCTGKASDSRFAPLDASHSQWIESLNIGRGEPFGITLALDERKAASLCLYADEDGQNGCGAIVVVAPVRPQLVRKPVKIAVVVEVKNPQEGLLTRELVDKLSSTLNSDDQVAIFAMGSSVTRKVMDWSEASQITEEVLGQLLEPSLMGRAQFFWESFQRVLEESGGASHILLATAGPKDSPPEGLESRLPVYALATGRKPNSSTLHELISGTGGFLSECSIDGIDSFLKRLTIRLSPPLLKDFRLEGWGLEDTIPSGITQVYTDKPTLVIGRYEGLIPKTVTLCGFSPAGQKLAQRVRVEKFSSFQLLPLLDHASRPLAQIELTVQKMWQGGNVTLLEVGKPVPTEDIFSIEQPAEPEPTANFGTAPPSIGPVSSAVTIDDGMMSESDDATVGSDVFSGAAGETISDDLFSGSGGDTADEIFGRQLEESADDFFAGSGGQDDFFSSEEANDGPTFLDEPAPKAPSGPPTIRPVFDSGEDAPQFTLDDEVGVSGIDAAPGTEPLGFDFSSSDSETLLAAPRLEPRASKELVPSAEHLSSQEAEPSWEKGSTPEGETSSEQEPSLGDEPSAEFEPSIQETPSTEREPSREPVQTSAERSTLTVGPSVPKWIRKLMEMDEGSMEFWLKKCPIDALALGLAEADSHFAASLVSKLDPPRRRAVEIQLEWGRLLSQEEREQACVVLEDRLIPG